MEAQSRLSFAHWADGAELIVNRYGIAEPDTGAGRIAVSALDLVLVPLVGLAYAAQEIASVPMDSWDIPLDYVLTERELVSVVRRDAS